jgi:uncharacterized protein (TIGR00369 family)
MTTPIEHARRALDEQPFSRLLGTSLTAFAAGSAELTLPLTPDFNQQHGFVHGGVVSTMADEAIAFAAGSVLGAAVLTAEYKINFLRPARGERLVARGRVVSHSQRQAVCTCEVLSGSDEGETMCAVAMGTVVIPSNAGRDEQCGEPSP